MEIREMVMRIPGISKAEAAALTADLQKALAMEKWQQQGGQIGDLEVKIQSGGEYNRSAMVAAIVKAMQSAISKNSGLAQ